MTNDFPGSSSSIMGLFCGAETVRPSDMGAFAPGAVAEHLTSWGRNSSGRKRSARRG